MGFDRGCGLPGGRRHYLVRAATGITFIYCLPGVQSRQRGRLGNTVLGTAMSSPVAIPLEDRFSFYHGAGQVPPRWEAAPCRRSVPPGRAYGSAEKSGSRDRDMSGPVAASRTAQQSDEGIPRLCRRRVGAGLVGAAGAVHLARGNSGQTQVRALGTPDGSVAVPHMSRRTREGLASGDHRSSECN